MLDLQNAVGSMMEFLLNGGSAAAQELLKGMVVKGATDASKLWHAVFREEPKSRQLVDQLAQDPQDQSAQKELRALLEEVLRQHPTIIAKRGSVAIGEAINTTITINNK